MKTPEITWTRVPVKITDATGESRERDFYEVWAMYRPTVLAYGTTIGEAVTNLLNRLAEEDDNA